MYLAVLGLRLQLSIQNGNQTVAMAVFATLSDLRYLQGKQ